MTPLIIGRHRGVCEGDLIEIEVQGVLVRDDVTALREAALAVLREHGRCFLVGDVSAMTGIDADARRLMAEWSKVVPERLAGTAIHGCNFAMRALLTLTLNAIRYFSKQEASDAVFVRDAAEARAWVDAQRAALTGQVRDER